MLSNPSWSSPTLIFMASNLHKLGLKVEKVSYNLAESFFDLVKPDEDTPMDLKIGIKKLQLFTAHPVHFHSSFYTFTFNVYLTNILENYQIHQMDGLLSQQLLSSTQEADVDFHLIAENGKRFPVHKWMLAARSPVFAALLSEDEKEAIMDCNVDVINQFIKFIYTGEFEGSVCPKLMQLAVKYEIKTLQDLCKNGPKKASLKEITRLISRNFEPRSSATDYVCPM
jgi:hypothetical protein